MEELLVDLEGGNGRWKKREAEEEMSRRAGLHVEKDLQDKQEQEIRRLERKDKQDWLMKALEEQQAKIQHIADLERLEDERQERQSAEAKRRHLLIEADNAQRKQLRHPRTCMTCDGGGKCTSCSGSGCAAVMYLSSSVGSSSQAFRGSTSTGCRACGGRKDGGELLDLAVLKGHGRCITCDGHGKTWLSESQIERAMKTCNE